MKDLTKSELGNCIKKYVFGNPKLGKNKYDIKTLFKLYSLHEVDDLDKIKENWNDFCYFMFQNQNKIIESVKTKNIINFRGLENKSINKTRQQIFDEMYKLKLKIEIFDDPAEKVMRNLFSGVVGDLISGNNTTVLDVGSGPIPDTSFNLAEKAKKVYAMDEFIVALDFIRKRGVEPLEEMFTSKTNIGNYDMIVGKSACTAIRPIVEVCSKTNTPYFLELCACDLENQRYKGKTPSSWQDILPNIDGNIKIYKCFAHNLDISNRQLDKLLEENVEKNQIDSLICNGGYSDEYFSSLIDLAVNAIAGCTFNNFMEVLENLERK